MFDAAAPAAIRNVEERRGALWPASLGGALLLHLAGFAALLWLPAPHPPEAPAEPFVIELALEPVPEEAPAAEAMPEEPPPPPEPEPPPEPAPPEPEPPPPVRSEPMARPPPPTPRPRPPQPPRERRPTTVPAATAPQAAPAPAPVTPAAPAGPPVVTSARFRRPPTPPDYPLVARERGITGTALIRALVGANGETKEVRLHRSSGNESLDSAALAAVRRWSFEPSSRDGRPIESWVEVPIRFQLR